MSVGLKFICERMRERRWEAWQVRANGGAGISVLDETAREGETAGS